MTTSWWFTAAAAGPGQYLLGHGLERLGQRAPPTPEAEPAGHLEQAGHAWVRVVDGVAVAGKAPAGVLHLACHIERRLAVGPAGLGGLEQHPRRGIHGPAVVVTESDHPGGRGGLEWDAGRGHEPGRVDR